MKDLKPDTTIVVDKIIPGSIYKSVELNVYNHEITVEDENGVPRKFAFRLLSPYKVNGEHYFQRDLLFRIEKLAESKNPAHRDYFSWVRSMIEFYLLCPEGLFKWDRKFYIETLGYKESFRKLAKRLQVAGKPHAALIEKAVEGDMKIDNLVDYAIYQKPEFGDILTKNAYEEYRDLILENVAAIKDSLKRHRQDIFKSMRRMVAEDEKMGEEEKTERIALIDRFLKGEPKEFREHDYFYLRRIIQEAYEYEEKKAKEREETEKESWETKEREDRPLVERAQQML